MRISRALLFGSFVASSASVSPIEEPSPPGPVTQLDSRAHPRALMKRDPTYLTAVLLHPATYTTGSIWNQAWPSPRMARAAVWVDTTPEGEGYQKQCEDFVEKHSGSADPGGAPAKQLKHDNIIYNMFADGWALEVNGAPGRRRFAVVMTYRAADMNFDPSVSASRRAREPKPGDPEKWQWQRKKSVGWHSIRGPVDFMVWRGEGSREPALGVVQGSDGRYTITLNGNERGAVTVPQTEEEKAADRDFD